MWFSRHRYALAFIVVAAGVAVGTGYGLSRLQEVTLPKADRSLRFVLPRAEWVQVIRAQPRIEIPITHISRAADEEPEMFALFQSDARFDAAPPATGPDLYFNVRYHPPGAEHGLVTRYGYDIETGVLGRDDDWAALHPDFQAWMRRANEAVPVRDLGFMRSEGRKVVAPMHDEDDGAGG